MINTHQSGPALVSNLNLKPVLEKGLVINAWATKDAVRIVCFEDYASYYSLMSKHGGLNTKQSAQTTLFGKHSNVELAFERAIDAFEKGLSYEQMYRRKFRRLKGSAKTTGKLDHWITRHKGTMRAVQDVDGRILCTLEGLKDPKSASPELVRLKGAGVNFRVALENSFKQLSNPDFDSTSVVNILVRSA